MPQSVRMPDGTVVQNVPDDMKPEQLLAMYNSKQGAGAQTEVTPPKEESFLESLGRPITMEDVKRSTAMAGRNVVQGLASLPDVVLGPVNYLTGGRTGTASQAADVAMTAAGVPNPQPASRLERYAGAVERGVGSALAGGGAGAAAGGTKVGQFLAENPMAQLRGTTAGSLAAQTAKEAGAGQVGQTLAGFAGGAVGAKGALAGRIEEAAMATSKAARAMNPTEARTLTEAHREGYVIPPSSVPQAKLGSMLEGIGGKVKVEQMARLRNQQVTDNLAARAVGINPAQGITPATLEQARQPAYKAYQAVQDIPVPFKTSKAYSNRIKQLGNDLEDTSRRFPGIVDINKVRELRSQLSVAAIMPKDAINLMRQLRADASSTLQRAYGQEKPSAEQINLGKAQRDAANAIERMVEANLRSTASGTLYRDFVNARQQLAKTYDIESALNPATGHINPQVLANIDLKAGGQRMTGDLRTIARFAQAFPKASGKTETIGGVPLYSPWETAMGIGTALGTHDPMYTAATLARPALRAAALSKPVQKTLIPKP